MSQVFLTAALGLITTGMAETRQDIFILDRSFFLCDAKSWLGFLVLLGLAAASFATALVVYPGEAIVPYG